MFGLVAEKREIAAVALKTAEARRKVSGPILELLGSVIDFDRSVRALIDPFCQRILEGSSLEERRVCEDALAHLKRGLCRNPSASIESLLVYSFVTLDQTCVAKPNQDEAEDQENKNEAMRKKPTKYDRLKIEPVPNRDTSVHAAPTTRASGTEAVNQSIASFALGLLSYALGQYMHQQQGFVETHDEGSCIFDHPTSPHPIGTL